MPNIFSCINSSLIDKIKTHYANDDAFKLSFENSSKESRFIEEIEQFKSYDLKNESLHYNARVCIIPKVEIHRLDIMHDFHDIPIVSHLGFQKTYMAIRCHYYWPDMKRDI